MPIGPPYFAKSEHGWASSTRRVTIWRRIISGRVIGWRRVIGPPVIAVIVGRGRQRHERRGDDRRGGADDGARHAERPEQRKRRARGIVLRLGGRERQSEEGSGERGRNRNSADTHRGLPGWDEPITIARGKTNANHIADFGIGMLDAN